MMPGEGPEVAGSASAMLGGHITPEPAELDAVAPTPATGDDVLDGEFHQGFNPTPRTPQRDRNLE